MPLFKCVTVWWMMVVTFTKVDGGRLCRWEAARSKRRRTTGHMGVGHDRLPHDLAGFAVESQLGLERGFWGLVEMGATFKSLSRKRTKQGRAIIREHVKSLDAAERQAGLHWRRWHEGRETPLRPAFDSLLAAWRQFPDGATISLEWPSGRIV